MQGGCQGGIARDNFRCSGLVQRKTDGVASDDPGKGSCSASVKEISIRARWRRSTRELGEFGRCRFGRHISAKGSHAAVMSSFPPRSASILFFFGSPRTNKSQTGRRRESRNSSVEIVRIDPNDVGRDQLAHRADEFVRGHWDSLLRAARQNLFNGSQHRELSEDEERIRRGVVAQSRIEQGQVSRARQALTGEALAPRNEHTREQLQNRRPQCQMQQIPQEVMEFNPGSPLTLDPHIFAKCLRSAPSGSAPGPGGCSYQMLKTCLDDAELLHKPQRILQERQFLSASFMLSVRPP